MNIMCTLSDVTTLGGDTQPPSAEELIIPRTIPKEELFHLGKSVENVLTPTGIKRWYVLRVTYHQEQKAKEVIEVLEDVETFLPTYKTLRRINGKRRFVQKCLLPNIIFVRTNSKMAEYIVKDSKAEGYVSYYYNHFISNGDGKNPPLIVPNSEMENFIKIVSVNDEHVRLASPKECRFKKDQRVRVTAGPFIGVEGRVARLAGQQRVVVELIGLNTVIATAYIPTAFMEEII